MRRKDGQKALRVIFRLLDLSLHTAVYLHAKICVQKREEKKKKFACLCWMLLRANEACVQVIESASGKMVTSTHGRPMNEKRRASSSKKEQECEISENIKVINLRSKNRVTSGEMPSRSNPRLHFLSGSHSCLT